MISIVISSRNEAENLSDTVACLLENSGSEAFEIVVVDDGSDDGSGEAAARRFAGDSRVKVLRAEGLGVARARNLGAKASHGETLVFLDGHCWCPPGWLEQLTDPLADPRVGLTGPAFADLVTDDGACGYGVAWPQPDLSMSWLERQADTPYPVPLLPGGCGAMRRALFDRLGGHDAGMGRWGSEGEELSLNVWLSGYEVWVIPDCVVRHLFRTRHPYCVMAADVLHNRLRLAAVHFSNQRLARVLDHCRDEPEFGRALAALIQGDTVLRRSICWETRIRDDDWWSRRFGLPW